MLFRRKKFDDCYYEVIVEGRFKAKAKVICNSLHVTASCKGCGREVLEAEHSDLKTRIAEDVRMTWDGYLRREEDGSVTHVYGKGLKEAVPSADGVSDLIYCARCGYRGIVSLKFELTDEYWRRLQEYRIHGQFYLLYGGLVEIELEIFGARFYPRNTASIQCKCNNTLNVEDFPNIFRDFSHRVSMHIVQSTPIPTPVEFEETIPCPRCFTRVKLFGSLNVKIPKRTHELAKAVIEWQNRQPFFPRTSEEVEMEPTY